MPTFLVSAPNGKKYRVNGPEGSTGEEAVAYIQRQLGTPPAAPEEAGFFSSMKEGMSNLLSTPEAVQFVNASPIEQDAKRKQFLESRASDTQGIAFDDVDNLPEFWQWLKQTAGQSAGALVVPAAGAIGAGLAKAPAPVAKGVGYALMGAQYVLDNLGRQAQEQEKDISEGRPARATDLTSAIVGAAAQTGLDAALLETAFAPILGRFPGLKKLFEAGEQETEAGLKELVRAYKAGELKLANGLYKGVMFGAAVEIPQEVTQQLIERWQAGLPLADTEAKKEYYESAVGALALGGAFGGVQQTMTQHGKIGLARNEIQREQDEVEAQQAERERLIEEQREATRVAARTATPTAPTTVTPPGTVTPAGGTTTTQTGQKPVGRGYLGGADLTAATDFVKNLAAQNNGVETRLDEWRDAVMAQFNISKEDAGAIMGLLHANKVLSRRYGKAVGGHYLSQLYEPTLRDQQIKFLADLDPEIRRVASVASEEDKAALDSLIKKITPQKNASGKNINLTRVKVDSLFTAMNDLLAKYKAPEAVPAGEPPAGEPPAGTNVPPPPPVDTNVPPPPPVDTNVPPPPPVDTNVPPPLPAGEAPVAPDITFGEPDKNGLTYVHAAMKRDGKSYVINRSGPDVALDNPVTVGKLTVLGAGLTKNGTELSLVARSEKVPNISVRMYLGGSLPSIEFEYGATGFARYEKGKPENADMARAVLGDEVFNLFNSSDDPATLQQIFTGIVGEDAAANLNELATAFNKRYFSGSINPAGKPAGTNVPPPPPVDTNVPPPPAPVDTRSDEDKVMAAFNAAGKANAKLVQEALGLNPIEAIAFVNKLYSAGLIAKSGKGFKLKKEAKPKEEGEDANEPPPPALKNTTGESTEAKAEALLAKLKAEGAGNTGKEVATQRNKEEKRLKDEVAKLDATPEVHPLKPIEGEEAPGSVTLKYAPDGYSVSALDRNGVAVGTMSVSQEGSKDSVGNVRVAADYRRHGIATAMFDRLKKLHPTLNFNRMPSSEEGDAFISRLHSDRVGTANEFPAPARLQEKIDEKRAEERRQSDIFKAIARVKEVIQSTGKVPVAHELADELGIARPHVDAAYKRMADEGYIKPATQTETDYNGVQHVRGLGYFVPANEEVSEYPKTIAKLISLYNEYGRPWDISKLKALITKNEQWKAEESKNALTDEEIIELNEEGIKGATYLKKFLEYKEKLAKILPLVPASATDEATTVKQYVDYRIKALTSDRPNVVRSGAEDIDHVIAAVEDFIKKYEAAPVAEAAPQVEETSEPVRKIGESLEDYVARHKQWVAQSMEARRSAEGVEAEEQGVEPKEGREAKAVQDNVLNYLLSNGPTSVAKLANEYEESVHPYVERALRKLTADGKITQDTKGNYVAKDWEKFNADLTAAERENNAALALMAKAKTDLESTSKEQDPLTTARQIMKRVASLCDFLISRGLMDLKKRDKIFRSLVNPKKKVDPRDVISDLAIKANKELVKMGKSSITLVLKKADALYNKSRVDIYNRSNYLTDANFDMLNGKPYTAYLDFISKTGSIFDQVMVRAISNVFNSYSKAGMPIRIVSVDNETAARKAYGAKWQNVNGAATGTENGIVVYLTNNVEGRSGYTPHTIYHEFLHAATMAAYEAGRTGQANPVQIAAAKDLDKLTAHVVSKVNELARAGKFTPEEMNFLNSTNFLGNADKSGVRRGDAQELLAWGIGDRTAQGILEKIQYTATDRGRKTIWDELVSILRRLLGLPAQSDTAFSELLRTFSAFVQETAAPEAAAGVTQFSATATNQQTFIAQPLHEGTFEDHVRRIGQQEAVRIDKPKGVRETLNNLFSHTNWEKVVTNFQSERRPLQKLSEYLDAAGVLDVFDRVNDLFGEITRSMAMSENILNETMWSHMVDLDKQIDEISKNTGKGKDVVLAELHLYAMARTEEERRKVFYEMNVPLNNKVDTTLDANIVRGIMVTARDADGKPIRNAPAVALDTISAPAARLRQIIKAELDKNQNLVSNGYAVKLRKALEDLVYRNNQQNVDGTVDGFSPVLGVKGVRLSTDINDRVYDVIGPYSRNQINEMLSKYNAALANEKTGPALRKMFGTPSQKGTLQLLQEATIAADKRSNYWSNPVDNRKAFYGWKNYVPLKGQGERTSEDAKKAALDELDFTGDRLGSGFNDVQGEMGGRASDSENPILQTMVDATKSALRYGRTGSMNAIANLIDKDPRTNKQYLKGEKVANIPFESRNEMIGDPKYSGPDKFFVYRPDGSIDIYKVSDPTMKEAIRRTFRQRNRLVELGNAITSGVGHMHTRYNIAFHPYNFVRDALTNAFTLGAEFGPTMAGKLIQAVATRTSQSGMLVKAAKISALYRDGKLDEIKRMGAAGDKFAADAARFFELGGRVTHLSGTDIREQGERLMRDVRRGNVARTKEFIDGYVDNWADSFELTSRLATFGVMRDYYTSKGKSLVEAETRASTYAKNLANFEQVGKYGREAGAIFMFFRPAATGAVRAIDALMPAFQSWESYKKNIPEEIIGDENSPEFRKIKKLYMERKQSAQRMMMGLAGAGAMMWVMAWMMSGDDDDGRNRVATDKMALWTRNIRLPLSMFGKKYEDSYVQIPWGFGLGAFGAMGAQVAGVAGGYTTIGEAIPNFITIALDSYVPVPVARVDPTENFSAFVATTFIPSVARPFVEYAMNVDSLGREIYNDRQTRYGDAFTGGRNTPQLWKDTSRLLFNITRGGVDVSPDTMLFWANNYLDGVSRIAQSSYGMSQYALTDKDFNVKEDFAPISSFIGRASNYDGEKFANLEQHMRELNQRYKSLERDPVMWREYVQGHQNEYMAVQQFNLNTQGWVKKLRSMRNQIEASDLSPRTKEEKLKQVQLATNYVKRGMIDSAKDMGVSF